MGRTGKRGEKEGNRKGREGKGKTANDKIFSVSSVELRPTQHIQQKNLFPFCVVPYTDGLQRKV